MGGRKSPFTDRWKGHEKELQDIISIFKLTSDWHESEAYKALMDSMDSVEGLFKEGRNKDLRGAPLQDAKLQLALLEGADLWDADLSGASLAGANLSGARIWAASLARTFLFEANISGADLSGANFLEANLDGVIYTTDEVFNRLIKWWIPHLLHHIPYGKFLKWEPVSVTNFAGIDTSKVDGSTNPVLKRYIEDYQFIRGFKKKSWYHRSIFYPLWKVISDCGRSLLLWLIWSVGLVGLFTWVYSYHFDWFYPGYLNWFDVLYFSVVTFTTLGFGDVHPNIGNSTAQAWVMSEVIIGYIMLGGLISILANKLARRA